MKRFTGNLLGLIISLVSITNLTFASWYVDNDQKIDFIKVIEEGDISLINRELHTEDIVSLSKKQIRIVRNSIYAKYGYIFKSGDLKEHFAKFSWYNPKNKEVDKDFSIIDKRNIKFLITIENDIDENMNDVEKSLIGIWQASSAMPSGWADHYHFFSNDLFVFQYSEMAQNKRNISYSGVWHVKENKLQIQVVEKIIIVGGKPRIDKLGESQISGGKLVIEFVTQGEAIQYSLGQEKYNPRVCKIKCAFSLSKKNIV